MRAACLVAWFCVPLMLLHADRQFFNKFHLIVIYNLVQDNMFVVKALFEPNVCKMPVIT